MKLSLKTCYLAALLALANAALLSPPAIADDDAHEQRSRPVGRALALDDEDGDDDAATAPRAAHEAREQIATPAATAQAEPAEPAFKTGTTLENLQAAFNGESNASAKYLVYADQARKEGYPSVAALFTAAAKAESIHAANHADVIGRMGGTAAADIKTVEPKDTAANLQDAFGGETFERVTMYPAYMRLARRTNQRDAVRTFNYALIAEAGHAVLYKETAEKLVEMKDKSGVTYYVCPTCGYTVTAAEYETFTKCPVCFTRGATFLAFN